MGHVDRCSIHDLDVENTANLILKSLLVKNLKGNGIAPSLASTKRQLEMEQSKNKLKQQLDGQMAKSEVVTLAHIDDTISPRLASNKKKLETAQKGDVISHTLKRRSSAAMHGVDMKISPAIQSIVRSLAAQRRRDSLKTQMNARPDKQSLIDMGLLKPFSVKLADSLQLDANQLEQALANQVSKEYLTKIGILEPYKKNVDAQPIDIEKASGMLLRALICRQDSRQRDGHQFGYSNVADSLQSTAKILDIQQKKDKINSTLQSRQSVEDVMQRQSHSLGYDISVAPSLQATIKNLGREMVKDALDKALRGRMSVTEAALHGVDVKNAALIQGTMHNLEMAQKRDSISKSMKRRPSADEIGIDTHLARGLQGVAKTLEMGIKHDNVSHQLANVGIVKKVKTKGLVASLDQIIAFLEECDLK